jgi:hypothetical protein
MPSQSGRRDGGRDTSKPIRERAGERVAAIDQVDPGSTKSFHDLLLNLGKLHVVLDQPVSTWKAPDFDAKERAYTTPIW